MELLKLQNVVYRAGTKAILDRFSLTVETCEIHALIGTNGSGKSTLAAMVMGCEGYAPVSGDILFEQGRINELKIHERARLGIAMAWQEPVRFEGLGVTEYLTLGDSGLDPAALLTMVGLEPGRYLQRQVDRSLSGGERRRIELASILGLKPRLAILDEPDSGIDLLSTGDIIGVVKRFKDSGSAVLLITHQEEIAAMADRASLMHQGRIVCTGRPEPVTAWYRERRYLELEREACRYV
jgi:Fe-S cluster assembly ATP-binding protein